MAALRDYLPFVARRNRAAARLMHHRTRSGLVASAAPLNLGDRTEARRVRILKQGWQDDAWAYRESLGEISFATRYMANSARRMRLYPAVYPSGTYDDDPVPLAAMPLLPPEVAAAADDALTGLGSGRLAISQIMYDTSSQLSVAGEGYIHGHTDKQTGLDTWRIRSIAEITVRNDEYVLREVPLDAQGIYGWEPLDPEWDYVARLWTPDQRFRMLATSPLKSILDSCEELMILSRAIRATGRSRLAGAGFLKVPNGLSIVGANDDNDDPESDPFLGALTEAMLTPIGDEGTASAVVPLVVRGDPASLEQFQHMAIERPIDPVMAEQRKELIARMATGIDLPSEVLNGMVDLNHWSAWLVSDDSFRHHIEPHVQECVDALTVGYFRARLEADQRMQGINAPWIARLCIWYDPTDLVQHPDRSADALVAHERMVISDAALREIMGFKEEDAPSAEEIELRMIRNTKTFPPNVLEALFHVLDPELVIPPIEQSGQIPGMGPKGAVPVIEPAAPGTPALPGPPPTTAPGSPPAAPALPPVTSAASPVPSIHDHAAAAHGANVDFSRGMAAIDRECRTRLQIAASHAVHAALSRAGARIRSKSQKDESVRAAISHTANHFVAAQLGRAVVAALGIGGLVDSDWSEVRPTYDAWVTAAQNAALKSAAQFVGLALDDPKVVALAAKQTALRENTWHTFAQQLTAVTNDKLYQPAVSDAEVVDVLDASSPDTVVPAGVIRSVMNVLGGGNAKPDNPDSAPDASTSKPLGQIASGDDITGLLSDNGAGGDEYQWVHGFAVNEFEPHGALDGVTFSAFDDPVLANSGDFPANEYFIPGDHIGCTCDYMILWSPPDAPAADAPDDE